MLFAVIFMSQGFNMLSVLSTGNPERWNVGTVPGFQMKAAGIRIVGMNRLVHWSLKVAMMIRSITVLR